MQTCADDDVDLDDISCKYCVVTIRINLPKISLCHGLGLSSIVLIFRVNFRSLGLL